MAAEGCHELIAPYGRLRDRRDLIIASTQDAVTRSSSTKIRSDARYRRARQLIADYFRRAVPDYIAKLSDDEWERFKREEDARRRKVAT